MKKVITYISWVIMFLQLNKALYKDSKDFHANIFCLSAGIHNMLKDRKITNEEVDSLSGLIADTCSSLITLIDRFTVPEEKLSTE